MNYFIQFLIVFDLICFGVYFGGDIICTALAKVRKKTDEEEFELYKVETPPNRRCPSTPSATYSAARSTILSATNFYPAGRRRFPP